MQADAHNAVQERKHGRPSLNDEYGFSTQFIYMAAVKLDLTNKGGTHYKT